MKHHISRGESIAKSMKDRFDYGQNPEKTQDGDLIRAYECDPATADAEFLLSKSKYKAITGREQKEVGTVYNLKQMAAALQFLQDNKLTEYLQLEQKTAEITDHFHALSDKIKSTEGAMRVNAELKAAVVDDAKTRPVFDGYKKAEYSKKYLAEHDTELALYRAAQATFKQLLNGGKLPRMDAIKAEGRELAEKKKATYGQYKAARKEMQDVVTAKTNIDHLLGLLDGQKNKEMER